MELWDKLIEGKTWESGEDNINGRCHETRRETVIVRAVM